MRASRAWIRPGQIGGNRRSRSAETDLRLSLNFRIKSSFFDRASVGRMLDATNQRCLIKAGLDIKEASKKGIGQKPPAKTKSGRRAVRAGAVVEFAGGLYEDLTMVNSGKPRSAGNPIKSWGPKRFTYQDIKDYFDTSRKTAVIGAAKATWLNQLHEFGGTLRLRAWRTGVRAARNAYLRRRGNGRQGRDERGRYTTALPQANQFRYGLLVWTNKKPRHSRNWEATTIVKTARYPARPFMQGARLVQKAVAKANEKWRNALRKTG
jgi:hypothetical protein